ncbi:LysR family transcriptional regulator [Brumicola nitratireducens]|uniref:LysR family transcriptional regulator n=1 Tax=Glaciecola nitratireducens (strain JCM 12485 / KCTC 12276 / FR1064) TaxID=1085623 RepID=G4QKK2_GLANF|nr:LysR family transcriptional regulator [Glaciecola nitratireducens]AEP30068.1 LysR family transcriptional regulator [Glaciecola nitratireducens FR1064]
MVSIKNLQAFIELAKYQSFAEAAEKRHISQPALSSAIKKMEMQLGGALFSRSTRSVKLTPEGASFLPVAKRLLDDWENALYDVKQLFTLEKGLLTLASMPSFAEGRLPSLLASFGYAQPNISIRVHDVVMELVIESVLRERAEMGFVFEPEEHELLNFYPMFNDEFVVIMPPDHALNVGAELTLDDVIKYPFVSMNRGSTTRKWVDEKLINGDRKINIAVEASQFSTIGNLVYSGMGIAIVPSMVQKQMEAKGCISKKVLGLDIIKRVGLITPKDRSLSFAAQAFIESLKLNP